MIDRADALATAHTIRTVDSQDELKTNIKALIVQDPRLAPLYHKVGVPSLRRNAGGFTQLMRAIVGQQLSVAAAASIWQRLDEAQLTAPAAITAASDAQLRAQGLSKQKIRYVRSLAAHDIDFAALASLPDEAVIDTLTAVVGVGRWTAEMYLLFSLGRADVLAVDDLAIRVAAMTPLALTQRPTPAQLRSLSKVWSPYRSAASLLLWAHYGWHRQQTGEPL